MCMAFNLEVQTAVKRLLFYRTGKTALDSTGTASVQMPGLAPTTVATTVVTPGAPGGLANGQ